MSQMSMLLFLFSIIARLRASAADDDFTGFIYAGCLQPKYDPSSPYQLNVDSVLSSVANSAAYSSYSNFTSSASASAEPVYGIFQCRGDLSSSDCASCVRSALSQLSSFCPFAAGAAAQLRGCFLRYGNDSFIGKPDTTLLYKKCGAAAAGGGYNSDQLGMRDAALAGLSTAAAGGAAGTYRVGAAGYVQAMAQCVGDQSGKQCDDCVAAAVAQLRNVCGFAVGGEAYLGKCYARFWSNGGGGGGGGSSSSFGGGSSGGGGIYDHSSDNNHGDEAGKTVAIIIGLIAGVALIIIFLSFLRKAGNYGKE